VDDIIVGLLAQQLTGRPEKIHENPKLTDTSAEIQTEYIPNKVLEAYRHRNPLNNICYILGGGVGSGSKSDPTTCLSNCHFTSFP
jgi:hypothetical protein